MTITGTGFTGATSVTLDGTVATNVVVVDDSTITAVTPARPGTTTATGVVLQVTTPGGTATSAGQVFTYVPAPDVTGVAPTSGPAAGGNTVTLTGTALTGTFQVTFGGAFATNVAVVNDTTVTVTAPAGTAGAAVDVVATNAGGSDTLAAAYTYVDPPTVTLVSPNTGTTAGGDTVTLTGTALGTTSAVTFGGVPATIVGSPTATSVTVTTPANAAGAVDVVVTTTGGSATVVGGFTYS